MNTSELDHAMRRWCRLSMFLFLVEAVQAIASHDFFLFFIYGCLIPLNHGVFEYLGQDTLFRTNNMDPNTWVSATEDCKKRILRKQKWLFYITAFICAASTIVQIAFHRTIFLLAPAIALPLGIWAMMIPGHDIIEKRKNILHAHFKKQK